ncbi:protein bangles and beads isoform X2 [Manduca sexta]|uniref:Uncharacterized protein n=1 Tax=Manduca sexta TaxID=7130 RepID=A0A922CFL5_MANSE|nr:protein bangles and beads isoform X2 [Manduca sexta]KAG6444472.1 hypothetical protein O3G_MSEX003406 [Manduca sexta]
MRNKSKISRKYPILARNCDEEDTQIFLHNKHLARVKFTQSRQTFCYTCMCSRLDVRSMKRMKVLLLCLAFAAVSMAMPVAEEKSEVAAPSAPVPEPAPAVKAEEVKPDIVVSPASPAEEKKVEIPETLPVPEAKSTSIQAEVKEVEVPKAEILADPKPEEKIPEAKSAAPESESKSEPKPVESESKPEEKPEEPKPLVEAESKSVETEVVVNEVPKEAMAKSAVPDEAIDVVSAIKNTASLADDIVDPAAIIPEGGIELPVATGKDAGSPAVKKDESAAPASSAEPAKPEPKAVEAKPEEKKEEIKATIESAPAPAAPKSADAKAAVDDDSLRVLRDTVDDKKATEETKEQPKSADPVVASPVVEDVKEDVAPKQLTPSEPAKDDAQEGKAAPVEAEKPSDLPAEKLMADAPAASSEESSEEKKNESGEKDSSSSDESTEAVDKTEKSKV